MICLIKENIDQVIFINLKYTIKKKFTLSTGCCFDWLPWTSTGSSHREMFLEINLNQETLKLYTYWVCWKNQGRSNISRFALYGTSILLNNFLKKIFNSFDGTSLFLYSMNTSKNQRFPDVFRDHRKRPVS